MTSTSTAAASVTGVEEDSPAAKSLNDTKKENCNRIRGGETHDIFGKKVDFADVYDEFKKYCPIRNVIKPNEKSPALEFASRMLSDVGPFAHKNKTTAIVKTFMFPVMVPALDENGQALKDDNGEEILVNKPGHEFKKVIVANRNQELSSESDDYMTLSVKHACLIAIKIMEPIMSASLVSEPPKLIMTPLATTVYSRQSIKAMATIFGIGLDEMLIKINCSAQRWGHLLDSSDVNCAVACTLFGTKNMEDQEKRCEIIERTMNGYIKSGAVRDITHMIIYTLFGMGEYFDEHTKVVLEKLNQQFQGAGKESECDAMVNSNEQILIRLMKYLASEKCPNSPELLNVFEFGVNADLKKLSHENGIQVDEIESVVDWPQLADQFGKYFGKPNIEKMVETIFAISNAMGK